VPKLERDRERINVEPTPPRGLVAGEMKLPVVDSADWDSELVAHSTSECTWLGKSEVMRI
jgi:hypothetical protein